MRESVQEHLKVSWTPLPNSDLQSSSLIGQRRLLTLLFNSHDALLRLLFQLVNELFSTVFILITLVGKVFLWLESEEQQHFNTFLFFLEYQDHEPSHITDVPQTLWKKQGL